MSLSDNQWQVSVLLISSPQIPERFSSPGWRTLVPSILSHWSFSDLLQQFRILPVLGAWIQYSKCSLTRTEQRGTVPSFSPLATSLLMHPGMMLAFWAAKAHCWLTSSFSYLFLLSNEAPQLYWSVFIPTLSVLLNTICWIHCSFGNRL